MEVGTFYTNNKKVIWIVAFILVSALAVWRLKKILFVTFDDLVNMVLQNEGGAQMTNDPDDPGGLTKYGISQRNHPDVDIANLTLDQAKKIYKEQYYDPLQIINLKDNELKMQVFDHSVNAGISNGVSILQKLVQQPQTGKMDDNTIAAANAYTNLGEDLTSDYKDLRKVYYTSIATGNKAKFKTGWLNRVDNTHVTYV
jgi:lysozyme family protein